MVVRAVPLSTMELSSHGLTPALALWYSEFGWFTWEKPTINHPVLYPHKAKPAGLALKLFRGEPAIPKLV